MAKSNTLNKIINTVTLAVVCITVFYLGTKEGFAKGRSLMLASMFYLSVLILLLSGRVKFSFLLTSLISLGVYFVSAAKFENMGSSLSVGDFLFFVQSFKEFLIIVYDFGYTYLLFLLTLSIVGILFFGLKERNIFSNYSKGLNWIRFSFLIAISYFGPSMINVYADYLYQNHVPITVMSYSPCISGFVMSAKFGSISIPDHLGDSGLIKNEISKLKNLSNPTQKPNIFIWLEESTFDPKLIDHCDSILCKNSLFESKTQNEFFSPLRVHVFGGGTWRSEFTLFSGMDHRIFGPSGDAAPVTVAPLLRNSLPRYLKSLGYKTIAIYPVDKNYLNAFKAYKNYGFDEVLDSSDFGESANWNRTDSELLTYFKRVLNKYKSQQPIFLVLLTMYQHGPHVLSEEKPIPKNVKLNYLDGIDEKYRSKVAIYLYRLGLSQKAIESALFYLDSIHSKNEKYLFVHFGDHHPNFGQPIHGKDFYSKSSGDLQDRIHEVTYFKMNSNFKIPLEKKGLIDIAYLGNQVMSAAGLPLNEYYQANQALLEACRGKYADCADKELLRSYYGYIFRELNQLNVQNVKKN